MIGGLKGEEISDSFNGFLGYRLTRFSKNI